MSWYEKFISANNNEIIITKNFYSLKWQKHVQGLML